jgi:hypothetical protein
MLVYRADFTQAGDEIRAQSWELGAYNYLKNEFHSDKIEVLTLGNEIVDLEVGCFIKSN